MSRMPKMQTNHLSIQEAKTCLRACLSLCHAGMAHKPVEYAVREMRATLVKQRGLRRYLYDMLGDVAKTPVRNCRILTCDGQVINPTNGGGRGGGNISLIDYLEQQFMPTDPPLEVMVNTPAGLRQLVL